MWATSNKWPDYGCGEARKVTNSWNWTTERTAVLNHVCYSSSQIACIHFVIFSNKMGCIRFIDLRSATRFRRYTWSSRKTPANFRLNDPYSDTVWHAKFTVQYLSRQLFQGDFKRFFSFTAAVYVQPAHVVLSWKELQKDVSDWLNSYRASYVWKNVKQTNNLILFTLISMCYVWFQFVSREGQSRSVTTNIHTVRRGTP
jgi:hypothetical protein